MGLYELMPLTPVKLRSRYFYVFGCGEGTISALTSDLQKIGFGKSGQTWTFDAYELAKGLCLTTGPAPVGDRIDAIVAQFETRASEGENPADVRAELLQKLQKICK